MKTGLIFKGARKKLLIPYVMAGYPSMKALPDILRMFEACGADAIEIGVPFSDPIADGPVIQAAGERALKHGVNLEKIMETVSRISPKLKTPLVLMSYMNPVQGFPCGGSRGFFNAAAQVGIKGVILPDVPPEESAALRKLATSSKLAWVGLVAPTSTPERVKEICRESTGFVYAVSVAGVTGARRDLSAELPAFLRQVRHRARVPVCLGFGISSPEHARRAAHMCDGVIVGSALIEKLKSGLPAAAKFLKSLRTALDNG